MTHHVYARRRGEKSRPVAGPFPTEAAAKEAVDIVRVEGAQRVYAGLSRRGAGPGSLNRRLGLAHLLAPSGVDA